MKLYFDCRYIRVNRHDGISRFTAELVRALSERHDVTMLISDRHQLSMLPDLPWKKIGSPTSILEPLVALRVNALAPDIVFSPMQTMGSFGRRYRLVLTVHDLIYYRHRTPPRSLPGFVRLLWRLYHLWWWPQRFLLNRADAVAAVSQTTRDLIAQHHLTTRPVFVVPNASSLGVRDADEPTRSHPTSRHLVYMGSFMPYKNVDTLVRAAALLPDYELHLMSALAEPEQKRLRALAPSARLVFHGGVTDEEYVRVLSGATALVTASRDEGFGIPLVESMGLGIPVVVSDIPIFREIGADAALYFPADDSTRLAAEVRHLDEPGEWARRSQACREQAARFNWDSSASALLRALEQTLQTEARPEWGDSVGDVSSAGGH